MACTSFISTQLAKFASSICDIWDGEKKAEKQQVGGGGAMKCQAVNNPTRKIFL